MLILKYLVNLYKKTHPNLNAPKQSLNNFSGSSLVNTRAVDVFFPNFCNKYSDSSATPPVPVKHPITFPSSCAIVNSFNDPIAPETNSTISHDRTSTTFRPFNPNPV